MPPIEIFAPEAAAETQVPSTVPARKRKIKPRRPYGLSFTDHLRLLLPFLLAGSVGLVARVKYP